MWFCTKVGFFSVVCGKRRREQEGQRSGGRPVFSDAIDPSILVIRARRREHLENLRTLDERLPAVTSSAGTDYPFRIVAPKKVGQAVLAQVMRDIDYTNFKDAAHDALPGDAAYHAFLSHTWSHGLDMEVQQKRRRLSTLDD
jgi:hypothetical protein